MSAVPSPTRDARYSRRELARLTLSGLAGPWLSESSSAATSTVSLGVQASRDLPPTEAEGDPVGALIRVLLQCEARTCELAADVIEPFASKSPQRTLRLDPAAASASSHGEAAPGTSHAPHGTASSMPQMMRRELRKWRLRIPVAHFAAIGQRFRDAGVAINAYSFNVDPTFSDEEIDRGFEMTRALRATTLAAYLTPEMMQRVAPFANRHRMTVALNRQGTVGNPIMLGGEDGIVSGLELSPYFKVAVDIGRLTAANVDPVAYIRSHHAQIASVYLTDWRKNGRSAVAWGLGDTPIADVLMLLKRERWPIPAYVRYADRGTTVGVDEVKRCIAYASRVLG